MNRRLTLRQFAVLLFCGLILSAAYGAAQTRPDSSGTAPPSRSPTGAMLRSAMIPGLGQAYNRQWLKSLLVAGIEGGLIVNAMVMNQRMLDSQSTDEYAFYEHNRGTFIWWLAGVHLLSMLDAYIDAHLFDFDINPLLGPAEPGQENSPLTAGMTLTYRF